MAEDPNPQDPTDWKAIAALMANGLLTEGVPGFLKAWQAANIETHGAVTALTFGLTEDVATMAGATLRNLEEPFLPVIAAFVAPILAGLFGAEVTEADLRQRLAPGAGNRGAISIVEGFMRAVVGDTPAEIQPSDAGAKRVAAAAVQASLESTFNALVPELLSDLLPFDLGHFKELTELPESIIRTLGVSRLVRRALQPIINVSCATPATWYMNKLHRPTLLGASTLAKQIARNPEKAEAWLEDLRREGYSEDRIEALLNEQAKFHSVTDLDLLVRASAWSQGEAVQHLRDQGYDQTVAETELLIERVKRIAAFERSMAEAAVAAYVDGRIDEGALGGFITGTTISTQEKAQYAELAAAKRICARRPLSPAETAAAVRAGILSIVDYRRALDRDGRDDEAIDVLDLLLRAELDTAKTIAQHKADVERQRAEEKAARDAAAAKRAAELAAAEALKERGSEATLEAAAIRGLIPLSRVEEIYGAKYDADTVAIYLGLLQAKRDDYVAQQAAAAAAKTQAAARGVDVGAIERAVREGVITLDDYRARLEQLRFVAADADLLTATLRADLQHRADAEHLRAEAAAAAKIQHIDLGRFEMLVRRGHRTMADYRALLGTFGYADADAAAMAERLQLLIDDDAAARKAQAAKEAELKAKGVSVGDFRRAVVLGVRTVDDFAAFLRDQGFTPDAQALMIAALRADVAEAQAARQRRIDADAARDRRRAPLSDVARAARLGRIPVSVYTARLRADGYTDDDVALETDLLVDEIAQEQAAKAARDAAAAAAANHGLSLAQVADLVRASRASLDDYRAAARAAGYSADAANQLVSLLADELARTQATAQARAAAAAAASNRGLSLAQVGDLVRRQRATLDDYRAAARAAGYSDDAAGALVALLGDELAADAAAAARRKEIADAAAVQHVSLGQIEAGVLAGIVPMSRYATAITDAGYGDDDAAILVSLLAARVDKQTDAAVREAAIDAVDLSKAGARRAFAADVIRGAQPAAAYAAWLTDNGYSDDEIELLVDRALAAAARIGAD